MLINLLNFIRARKDPVCGARVLPEKAFTLEHNGHIYYFDSEACRESFRSNPTQFIKKRKNFLKKLGEANKDVPKSCHECKK